MRRRRPRPRTRGERWRRAAAGLLLALPVLALLAVPVYSRTDPRLAGVPFFYWYQLAWVPLSILAMAGAAWLLRPPRGR